MLHEIAHGLAVLPGPIPVNAGETTGIVPPWVASRSPHWPPLVFRRIWELLVINGRVTRGDVAEMLPSDEPLCARWLKADGLMVTMEKRACGRLVRHPAGSSRSTEGWWLAERIDWDGHSDR